MAASSPAGPRTTRIAYHGGGWVTNIGNAYYNLGVEYLLREIVGRDSVYFMPDITDWIWRTDDAYDPTADVDADLWLFSGPGFSAGIVRYERLFRRLVERGKRIGFISIGLWEYTDEEWDVVREFLDPFLDHVDFISTRDRETYRRASSLGVPCFDGICGSMFLDDAVTVPRLARDPYIVMNFGAREEPLITVRDGEFVLTPAVEEPRLRRRMNRLRSRLGRRGASKEWPRTCGEYDIVRTRSASFNRNASIVFDRPDMQFADVPLGSLAVYRSAQVVFTDRVHTTASTLILGGTARYVFTGDRARDGRWLLLERVGVEEATTRPSRLDFETVATEKSTMKSWLSGQLGTGR